MKRAISLVLLLSAAVWLPAQDIEIDTTTPEGALLHQIGVTENPEEKAMMLEQFIKQYPDHEGVKWVLAQLPPVYVELKQPEKSLEWCEKLLEKVPTDSSSAHSCLKTAEGLNDPELVRKWAVITYKAAKAAVEAPKPEFEYEEDEEEWKQGIEFAKQVGQYAEWSLYNAALQTQDPDQKIKLYEALKEIDPNSKHLPSLTVQVFLAYQQAGNVEQAVALAERAVAEGQANEDMLLVAADYYLNKKKDTAKTLEYATKLVNYLENAQPPEGVPADVWEKKKKASLGLGYWMMGVSYSTQKKYATADKTLRKALPYIRDNAQLLAGAYFHLGLANYQMGSKSGNAKMLIAARDFFKKCAAINSPFRAQARKNLAAIESQYRFR